MAETILVTGGAGYIGSHTCKALAKAGFTPVVYDNLSTGHAYAIKWGPFVQGDIGDPVRLSEAITSFKPKAVLHFAGSALVVESVQQPAKYYRNNLSTTLTLLETMREHHVQNLLFSSSCATYGHPQFTPITEEHPQFPVSPYGRTKWMAEQMMIDFGNAYGLKSIFLRYFNAAGADLETQIGENHTPETHLIPSIIQTALGIKEEIVVYGTDFSTPDGSAIRDYIHVQDLADAHVLALQYLLEKQTTTAINLGTGKGSSVLEIINAIQTFCSKAISVRLENRRPAEPSTLTADNQKAKQLLGWQPNHSTLPILIESAWKWHQLLLQNSAILRGAIQRLESHPR
ncbi:MAG TPA: UDP-glucose 4-epimerase GalE [Chlamydiales bacterium]|jgi:UDP-glucose-4-epimerase GalE|nr:UDP-glucose 4-epimerase GalE [Chlamydiales bacterium]